MRWVDYWDSSAFPAGALHKMAKSGRSFPKSFGEPSASPHPLMASAADGLQTALHAGAGVETLFTYDAVWEDVALRAQVIGPEPPSAASCSVAFGQQPDAATGICSDGDEPLARVAASAKGGSSNLGGDMHGRI